MSIQVMDDWHTEDALPASVLSDELIQKRTDVAAAKARLDAALAARKLALAARTRDVTVGLQFEHYPTSPANQLGSGNSYGISIQIPCSVATNFREKSALRKSPSMRRKKT
jgi:cobalt-zinc-cadmium efflux system outer membrane protein